MSKAHNIFLALLLFSSFKSVAMDEKDEILNRPEGNDTALYTDLRPFTLAPDAPPLPEQIVGTFDEFAEKIYAQAAITELKAQHDYDKAIALARACSGSAALQHVSQATWQAIRNPEIILDATMQHGLLINGPNRYILFIGLNFQ